MSFLPICMNVGDTKVVIIGGGRVAEQKLRTILLYAPHVFVCAPQITEGIRHLQVTCLEKPYTPDVLEDAGLVYACTNDRALNHGIAADCRARRVPVCVADDPASCDFVSPAVFKKGHMSVAVSSDAREARRSVAWRDRIRKEFEHDCVDG